jgi:DNA-directed RNA polymerase subunit RPC12/RpoP
MISIQGDSRGDPMSIVVTCTCGKQLKARDEYLGRRAKCPACGIHLLIRQSATAMLATALVSVDQRSTCAECGGSFVATEVVKHEGVALCRQCLTKRPPPKALPWASLIGVKDDPGLFQQGLTWPIAIGAFIAIGLFFFLLSTFVPSDNPMMPFKVSIVGSIALLGGLAGCIAWHRRQRNRPDSAPDLLAELFPPTAIMHAGRVHFTCLGVQSGGFFRVIIVIQNRFDQATHFKASFTVYECASAPQLERNLTGSEGSPILFTTPVPVSVPFWT